MLAVAAFSAYSAATAQQIAAAAPMAVQASRRVVLMAAREDDDTLPQVSRELLDQLLESADTSAGLAAFPAQPPPT